MKRLKKKKKKRSKPLKKKEERGSAVRASGSLRTVGSSRRLLRRAALHHVYFLPEAAKTLQIRGLVSREELLDLFQRTLDFLSTGTLLRKNTGED